MRALIRLTTVIVAAGQTWGRRSGAIGQVFQAPDAVPNPVVLR